MRGHGGYRRDLRLRTQLRVTLRIGGGTHSERLPAVNGTVYKPKKT